uniref:Uncharacterized protein n=1 Tax=Meloidogyne incognita TaxID=6306 RepID=A0A914LF26_MELIC
MSICKSRLQMSGLQMSYLQVSYDRIKHTNIYGLFLPPCDGRAGKFLLDDRPLLDYPFHDCAPYVALKFKKRVYKMLRLDEKTLRSVHSKSNLRKFSEAVQNKNI